MCVKNTSKSTTCFIHVFCNHLVGCESLLDDFDPLRSQPVSIPTETVPPQQPDQPSAANSTAAQTIPSKQDSIVLPARKIVELSITDASPGSSPVLRHRSSNPFRVSGDFSNVNPFEDSFVPDPFTSATTDSLPMPNGRAPLDMRHCTSETNLSKLKKEYQPLRALGEVEPLVTRSEEDILSSTAENRHCMADMDSHGHVNGGLESPGRNSGSRDSVNDPLDYKNRRSRSSDNSPTTIRKLGQIHQGSVDSTFSTRLNFHSLTGSLKPLVSKADVRAPEMSSSAQRATSASAGARGRRRAGSRAPPPSSGTTRSHHKKSRWVSRYRPGVPIAVPGESARESIMQSELRHREEEFCDPKLLR